MRVEVEEDPARTPEDKEMLMETEEIVKAWERRLKQEGLQEGLEQGLQKGLQKGILQRLQTERKMLLSIYRALRRRTREGARRRHQDARRGDA